MLNNITLGQYYPVKSVVHALDPRAKILLTGAYITAIFLVGGMAGYVPVCLFVLLAARVSRLPLKMLLRGLKPLRVILIFTLVFNIFFTPGTTVLFKIWVITLTSEGVLTALRFALRLVLLVLGTSILTLTTSPVALTDGLERLMSPLRVIRFPAHELAMMMTIALRFIPTLMEEADKIMKAQMARGADFESGNLITRAKAMVPLLVPLFVSAFRRAGELAMAMEARCYHGGEGRTRLRILKLTLNDLYAVIVVSALLLLVILESVLL
jgi:energy-coupling factor transport system permease protein